MKKQMTGAQAEGILAFGGITGLGILGVISSYFGDKAVNVAIVAAGVSFYFWYKKNEKKKAQEVEKIRSMNELDRLLNSNEEFNGINVDTTYIQSKNEHREIILDVLFHHTETYAKKEIYVFFEKFINKHKEIKESIIRLNLLNTLHDETLTEFYRQKLQKETIFVEQSMGEILSVFYRYEFYRNPESAEYLKRLITKTDGIYRFQS